MDSLRKEVPLDGMEKVRTGVIATFAFFDGHVQECRDLIDTLEKEGEAKGSLVPETGIFELPSISSAVEEEMKTGDNYMAPWNRPVPKEPRLWRTICLSLVTWLVVVSLPFTVLSTFLCEAPDGVPMYDSNFYSTLSQQLLGFGGLYAIVKPQVMQWLAAIGWFKEEGEEPPKGIETKWPITFNCLVSLAFVTQLASAPVYPYYPQSSIPLGAVAAICANLATLLIIEDTGSQIVGLNEEPSLFRNSALDLVSRNPSKSNEPIIDLNSIAFSYDANIRSPQSACRWGPASPQEPPGWLQLASLSEHILAGIGRLGAVLIRPSRVE
ncbi:hypothetical protein COL5a_002379 [Colletotrichum fioriniae]|nr:hypothetical protein COL5a_002379 [Colletotrichum fioriniae]